MLHADLKKNVYCSEKKIMVRDILFGHIVRKCRCLETTYMDGWITIFVFRVEDGWANLGDFWSFTFLNDLWRQWRSWSSLLSGALILRFLETVEREVRAPGELNDLWRPWRSWSSLQLGVLSWDFWRLRSEKFELLENWVCWRF